MMGALAEVARGLPVLLPAHPRARVDLQRAAADLGADVRVIDPLGYLDFVALQSAATLVLTDSGGVQEETTALGVPCLTLRNNTERPITVTEGTNQLVGTDPNRIVAAARAVLADGVTPRRPAIWDGHAADRIADVIVEYGRGADRRRPTDR
jgi:UDP-N-acetylglucosamine 2-epimerase (non-hydrolysing)